MWRHHFDTWLGLFQCFSSCRSIWHNFWTTKDMTLKLTQLIENLISNSYVKFDDGTPRSRDSMTSHIFYVFGAPFCNLKGWKIRFGRKTLDMWKNSLKSTRNWKQNWKSFCRSGVITVFVTKSAIFDKNRVKFEKNEHTHNFWTNKAIKLKFGQYLYIVKFNILTNFHDPIIWWYHFMTSSLFLIFFATLAPYSKVK